MRMKTRDVACGICLVCLSGVLWMQTFPQEGGISFDDDIDPMLYPKILIGVLAALGAMIAARGFFAEQGKASFVFTKRTAGVSLVLAAYAALFTTLGFFLSSLLGGAGIAFIFGWRKPFSLAAVMLGSSAAIWVLFTHILRIPLPSGIFF